jgi:hypothetical protein
MSNWLWECIVSWLNTELRPDPLQNINDFDQLVQDIHPADVILFEGRTRVSEVIKLVTLSPWTHAALYIGTLSDIDTPSLRKQIARYYTGHPDEPLVIESLLGYGTVINPLKKYKNDHLRICRAVRLTSSDAKKIIPFALEHLGMDYDVRQLMDLARLMFPYAILPRRWRSTLFQHNAGKPTHIVCSSMIARCFQQVHYPILPIVETDEHDKVRYYKRSFRLFVPSDFDYSPFFDVIKFPAQIFAHSVSYHNLPWCELPGTRQIDPPPKQSRWGFPPLFNTKSARR